MDHRVFNEPPKDPSVLGDPDQSFNGLELRCVNSPHAPQPRLADASVASQATVHGIAFDLYDGRGFYPDESRVSFLFASSEDLPELNGQLVEVHDKAVCMASTNADLRQADWYLTRPSIHMRHYLEDWMDVLLGSVKYFLLPDLWFWRYRDLPDYGKLSDLYDSNADPSLRLKACEWLQLSLSNEIERWSGVAAEQRSFWDRAYKGLKSKG